MDNNKASIMNTTRCMLHAGSSSGLMISSSVRSGDGPRSTGATSVGTCSRSRLSNRWRIMVCSSGVGSIGDGPGYPLGNNVCLDNRSINNIEDALRIRV